LTWASAASAASGDDVAAEARAVFAAKCAGCHGPDLPKPKGRFGYVLDLRRVASNPEMIIPFRPDESELWVLIQRGEMPPDDSPAGPLSAGEKEVIRRWIEAGAPDVLLREAADGAEQTLAAPSAARRTLRWLGKLHLLCLHFPIALALAAGVAELWAAWRLRAPSDVVRFCLWLAAAAAVPTVVFGWLHAAAGEGAAAPVLLSAHRWLGTAAGSWLLVVAVCNEVDARSGKRSWRVRVMLFVGVLLTAVAAHVGGLLDRGAHFFDW
jgi:hypothetical protein